MRVACLIFASFAAAQQKGAQQAENHPQFTTYNCEASGQCTPDTSTSIVLDANWRWTHQTSSSTNCYTGDEWNTDFCPDPVTCAANCAIDGADYAGTYGITVEGDEMAIKLATVGQYDTNIGARTYVMADDAHYKMYNLLNREFTFVVDVSALPCGLDGALYFVDMDADGGMSKYPGDQAGAAYGTGYCDAQCPQDIKFINGEANILDWIPSPDGDPNSGTGFYGTCCTELDVWEANVVSTAVTPHMCTVNGQYRCNGTECGEGGERFDGVCDKDGCDMNPWRGGVQNFYGSGAAPPPDTCNLQPDMNNMGTILGTPSIQTDPIGCCAVCNATAGCVGFTFVSSTSNCFLKSALGTPVADPGATSGSITPPASSSAAAAAAAAAARRRLRGVKGASTRGGFHVGLELGDAASGFTVDTTQPFTVITQFVTSDGTDTGDLVEIRRSFIQNGVHIPHPAATNIGVANMSSITDDFCKAKAAAYNDNDNFETFGGLKRMGEVMSGGMVLVLSQWLDYTAHMLWLDSLDPSNGTASTPGVSRGSCAITSGNPSDIISNNPGSTVKYSAVSVGPIGFSEARLKLQTQGK